MDRQPVNMETGVKKKGRKRGKLAIICPLKLNLVDRCKRRGRGNVPVVLLSVPVLCAVSGSHIAFLAAKFCWVGFAAAAPPPLVTLSLCVCVHGWQWSSAPVHNEAGTPIVTNKKKSGDCTTHD